jgi:hypothetical protein
MAGFSELSFFKRGVLFGAGNFLQAHALEEFIERKNLARLPRELIKIVGQVAKISP